MQNTGGQSPAAKSADEAGELAAIRISGQDRVNFLQGQLTQDVARLNPERPLLAGWASPKGRLLCVPWLADWQDAIWLILPRERSQAIAKRLKMFVLRADVHVEVADAQVEPTPLKQLTSQKESQTLSEIKPISYCFYNNNEFSVVPPGIRNMGIRVQPGQPAKTVEPTTLALWRLMNIRAGLPVIGDATAEEFVPQMVNLDLLDAISFTKGCYVGQEIVARTQNLGRIKRRMYAFKSANGSGVNPVRPGHPVFGQDGIVGQIVDAIVAEAGTEMLAVIRLDCLEQQLSLDSDCHQPILRQPLPYDIP